mgnify:FL=1|tara:strand:+ start:403 stop:639 length:237 start_codon:yes stop_codon:yes gene_type:complete
MSLEGCDARVDVGNIQVKCGSTVWKPDTPYSSGQRIFCHGCNQQWETLAEKFETLILEDMNSHLPEWWEKLTKGHQND